MSILHAFKEEGYRWGDCQVLMYDRKNTALFPPGFLGDLYFKFLGDRYSTRPGTGILEALFCGMTDVSYDRIVAYLANLPINVMGVWHEGAFKVAGIAFPTIVLGAGEEKACFAGYGFVREFWGTDDQEVLAMLCLTQIFVEAGVKSIHGIRLPGNDLTAKFMERFGFRDIGTIPDYMLHRGKLVGGTVSTLSLDAFEQSVNRIVLATYKNIT